MLTLVKIIILLGFLVFIHEGGHFCVAKLCKINVKEFSIGFGPKIISKLKNETNYEIRLIPLDNFSRCISEYYFWANCIFYSNIS